MNALMVIALLAGLKVEKGPAELRIGNSSVQIPAGCEGSITLSIDAVMGAITCGALSVTVFGPPGDPCDPCGFDSRPRCAGERPDRSIVRPTHVQARCRRLAGQRPVALTQRGISPTRVSPV